MSLPGERFDVVMHATNDPNISRFCVGFRFRRFFFFLKTLRLE